MPTPPQDVEAVAAVVMPPESARAPLAERMMAMSSQVEKFCVQCMHKHHHMLLAAPMLGLVVLSVLPQCMQASFTQMQPHVPLQAAPAAVQEPLINGNASAGIVLTPAADVATVMPLQAARSPDATTIPAEVSDTTQPSVGHMHTCIGTCSLHRVAAKQTVSCTPLRDRVSHLY